MELDARMKNAIADLGIDFTDDKGIVSALKKGLLHPNVVHTKHADGFNRSRGLYGLKSYYKLCRLYGMPDVYQKGKAKKKPRKSHILGATTYLEKYGYVVIKKRT